MKDWLGKPECLQKANQRGKDFRRKASDDPLSISTNLPTPQSLTLSKLHQHNIASLDFCGRSRSHRCLHKYSLEILLGVELQGQILHPKQYCCTEAQDQMCFLCMTHIKTETVSHRSSSQQSHDLGELRKKSFYMEKLTLWKQHDMSDLLFFQVRVKAFIIFHLRYKNWQKTRQSH